MLDQIDHIGVAVEDMEEALSLYTRGLGLELQHREVVEEQGVDAALLEVGDGHVELLAALGPQTPIGRYLDRRGPGLHHVAYAVADIDAALAEIKHAGIAVIDEQPRVGIRNSRVAFLHPGALAGVLTELVEPAEGL